MSFEITAPQGRMYGKVFVFPARVYYEDTDAGGIVYHANYLKFCERARTEWLRTMGMSQNKMLEDKEGFVIVNLSARYKHSAKLDDMLKVTCSVIKLRKVAISFSQQIFNEKNELLFELECDVAFINMKTGLPKAMPSEAYQYAQGFLTQKS